MKQEIKPLLWIVASFLTLFFLPVGVPRFDNAVFEALQLAKWYAREHVILCLIPALFIAGAIGVFVRQGAILKCLGQGANRILAYGVASVSGTVLAVCSCTVLPLFAGIYKMGAGLGPATAFLYSGPAINVLAIILTARLLGAELGIARVVGAVVFSVVIGWIMQGIFKEEETQKKVTPAAIPENGMQRPAWQSALFLAVMVLILVIANWAESTQSFGFWHGVYSYKWALTGVFSLALGGLLVAWFGVQWWKVTLAALPPVILTAMEPAWIPSGRLPVAAFAAGAAGLALMALSTEGEAREWVLSSWDFAKLILPPLFVGVLIAGFMLGRPGHEGILPSEWISGAVGGNSIGANLFASGAGAFMYFATLTELPILQGLLDNGMGKGPALALLLAGPAVSLPSILVLNKIMGYRKTAVFISLVVVMATVTGLVYGMLF